MTYGTLSIVRQFAGGSGPVANITDEKIIPIIEARDSYVQEKIRRKNIQTTDPDYKHISLASTLLSAADTISMFENTMDQQKIWRDSAEAILKAIIDNPTPDEEPDLTRGQTTVISPNFTTWPASETGSVYSSIRIPGGFGSTINTRTSNRELER